MSWRIERSSFVGRIDAIQQLRGYLDDGARLLTILGAPGLGKTRLARRLGGMLADEDERVWFCDLTAAVTCADVLGVVARELGVPLTNGATDDEASVQLGHALAARGRLVLLLDNFEQVVAHAEATVARWLVMAPRAVMITTSRERLGLDEEVWFELQPLTADEGAKLFEDRGRPVRADLVLADKEREAVFRIVEKLEGIPLAIELSAARMAVLLPTEIAARLDARFELLRAHRRGAPARHLTLERAIDWSFELLSPWERAAFAQCAVFRGGFSLEAAEAVIDLSAYPDAPSVLDVLQSLCHKSIVRRYVPSGASGGTRFGLFESLRAYADRKLDEASRSDAEARHARYYVRAAEGWAELVSGAAWKLGLERLSLESSNLLRVVERRALEPVPAFRAALALDVLLARVGPLQTRLAVLEQVSVAEKAVTPAQLIRYLQTRADAAWMSYRFREAQHDLERAHALARREGDWRAEVAILLVLGDLAVYRTDPQEVGVHYLQAIAVARGRGERAATIEEDDGSGGASFGPADVQAIVSALSDRRSQALALRSLSIWVVIAGRLERGLEITEMARAAADDTGDPMLEAALASYARTLELALDRAKDTRGLEQACEHLRVMSGGFWLEIALEHLAGFLHAEGRLAELRATLDELASHLSTSAHHPSTRMLAARRGGLEAEEGHLDLAEAHFAEARSDEGGAMHPVAAVKIYFIEGVLDLARARRAAASGRADEALAHEDAARRRLASLNEHLVGATRLGASIESRILARALLAYEAGAFALGSPEPSASTLATELPEWDLEVSLEGRWFRARRGERVSLYRRQAQWRILAYLVQCHAAAPGKASTIAELVQAGWPGEKIQPDAATNRLHNAVAQLRSMGLRTTLTTNERGYFLDAGLRIRMIDDEAPARRD